MLTVALSKGRILKDELAIFMRAGFNLSEIHKDDRRLIFEFPEQGLRLMLMKPFDVPVYVEKGAADLGIVGSDVVSELKRDVYSILDLGIGACRISVAKPKKASEPAGKLRIGTKFPVITRDFYQRKGISVEIIKLYGSIELAPLTGIADCIVDIVSSGETLRKNGLVEAEQLCTVSSRLIANRTSFKTHFNEVRAITEKLRKAVEQ